MKKIWILSFVLMLVLGASAQSNGNKLPGLDKSPMDMAYYPVNFPVLKIQEKLTEPLIARVIYSRPVKNNRTVFGELVEFNKLWRLGANEATEVEFFRDVKINGRKIPKGKYSLYAVVTPSQWEIIVNKETDTWGAFKYDEKKDVVRVKVQPQKVAEPVEAFTIAFEKANGGINLNIAWDTELASLPISLK